MRAMRAAAGAPGQALVARFEHVHELAFVEQVRHVDVPGAVGRPARDGDRRLAFAGAKNSSSSLPELRAQGMPLRRFVPPVRPLSAAYIQQQLSFLRVYASWIGKPGMVLSASEYVDEPALVRRVIVAQRDRSWSAASSGAQRAVVGASRSFATISSAPRWNVPKQRLAAPLVTLVNLGAR